MFALQFLFDILLETIVPSKQRRTRGEPLLRIHNTGSARSEGYYKIPLSEKSQYLSSVMRQLETKDETNDKESASALNFYHT